MELTKLLRGDKQTPFHLSVGGVLIENDEVYLIKKGTSGVYTLPRETISSDESLESGVMRCFAEEVGKVVSVGKFLGSLITYFPREDGARVEKTTTYFMVEAISSIPSQPTSDELDDEVVKIPLNDAITLLREQGDVNGEEFREYLILERVQELL